MKTSEIKKALYKQNPEAYLKFIRAGVAYYYADILPYERVRFEVPVSDMGDAAFEAIMEAKLLQRWIVNTAA